jgi:hypothetical protein
MSYVPVKLSVGYYNDNLEYCMEATHEYYDDNLEYTHKC